MDTNITVFAHTAHFIIPVEIFTPDYMSHSETATLMFTAVRTPHHAYVASVSVYWFIFYVLPPTETLLQGGIFHCVLRETNTLHGRKLKVLFLLSKGSCMLRLIF